MVHAWFLEAYIRLVLISRANYHGGGQQLTSGGQKPAGCGGVRLTKVLGGERVDSGTSGQIYLGVVQSVMMYGSETWVMTQLNSRVLGGFRHRVARRLTGSQPCQGRGGVWTYPLL